MPRSPECFILLLGEGRLGCQLRVGAGGARAESLAMGGPSLGGAAPPTTPFTLQPSGPAQGPPAGGLLRDPVGGLILCMPAALPRRPSSLAPVWPPACHLSPGAWCCRPISRQTSCDAWLPSLRLFEEFLQRPVCNKKKLIMQTKR